MWSGERSRSLHEAPLTSRLISEFTVVIFMASSRRLMIYL